MAARRAPSLGIGLLSGGYGQEELERAGAYRVCEDPADLLRHIDEVGAASERDLEQDEISAGETSLAIYRGVPLHPLFIATGGPVHPIISVSDLTKTYASGFQALKEINLRIWPGEIFALLGPNGAGNDLDRHHMRDRQSDQRRCHGRRP